MITYTFSLTREKGGLTPVLSPGILAEADNGGRVVLGSLGTLSSMAVIPFWPVNPPACEERPDGLLAVMDAYPIEPGDGELMLAGSREPEGQMAMVRFFLGAGADSGCKGTLAPSSGEPSVIGMAAVCGRGRRWPWQWRTDSVWVMSRVDAMLVTGGAGAWEVSLADGLPVVRRSPRQG